MLLLVKCSGTAAEVGESLRERYVRALVSGRDAAVLVDRTCSVSAFTEFLEGWQVGIGSVQRNEDWDRFRLDDPTGKLSSQTQYLTATREGVCLTASAFGDSLPESYPGEKCSKCTIRIWPQ